MSTVLSGTDSVPDNTAMERGWSGLVHERLWNAGACIAARSVN